jgi:hypothetical protein
VPLPANGLSITPRVERTAAPAQPYVQRLRFEVPGARAPRRLLTLPGSWDQAVVTFRSPTALTAPSSVVVPFGSFSLVGPYYEFVGTDLSSPVMPVLRPSTDYTITADLESTATTTLEAYGIMPGFQTVNAGANTFSFTLTATGNDGSEIPVETAAGAQDSCRVALDPDTGEFLVVWADAGDIKARRYDAAGAALGAGSVTLNTVAGAASGPVVAYNSTAAKYLVAWQDARNGHNDIYARSMDASDVLGTEAPITHTVGHTANETEPAIASASGADRFLVAWTDDRNVGSGGLDVYANRVDSGVVASGEVAVAVSALVTNQRHATVSYAFNVDKFVVVVEDDASGTIDLRYQRVAAGSGATQDGATGAVLTGAAGDQDQTTVCYNNADGLLLTAWRDSRNGPNTDIYYNVFNPNAGTFPVSDTALIGSGDTKSRPKAAFCSVRRDYMVMFADDRSAGDVDVFVRRLLRDGVTQYGEKPVVQAANAQTPGGLCYAFASDQLFSVWQDDRSGAGDIYAQRLR